MARPFAGRVFLVTGASRGLGRALAERLGRGGAQVVATARTVGGLEDLDDRVKAAGGAPVLIVPLDLADGDGIDRLGAALYERFGRLDGLCLMAAAGLSLTPTAHLTPKDLTTVWNVNAAATHRLVRSLDPLLARSDAPILLFAADDKAGRPHWAGYGASKAAAEAILRSYAAETPRLRLLVETPPAMPTALRGRTHPGERRGALAGVDAVAERMIARLLEPH